MRSPYEKLLSLLVSNLLLILLMTEAYAHQKPLRVVSLNLCTDQLLLALADRHQIASLSHLVRDPTISFLAEQASGLPVNDGTAESILSSEADLVLTGTYGSRIQASLLQKQGLKVLPLGSWSSLREGRDQIRLLAQTLGHPERGEALIESIEGALQRTRNLAPGHRSVLAFGRGGWVTGEASLQDDLIVHMGLTPYQEKAVLPRGGFVPLEMIVAQPPDYLLVDEAAGKAIDNGSALFMHPALDAAIPRSRRLQLSAKLTICGGPSTPEAIDALGMEVRRKVR